MSAHDAAAGCGVDEFIDALALDEPACHHRCMPGINMKDAMEKRCMAQAPRGTFAGCCSLPKRHWGPHVACAWHGDCEERQHAMVVWPRK